MCNEPDYDPFNFALMQNGEVETHRTIERTRSSEIAGKIIKEEVRISPTSIILMPINKIN